MTDHDVVRPQTGCRYTGPDRRTSPLDDRSQASPAALALVLTLAVLAGIGIFVAWDVTRGGGQSGTIGASIVLGATGALAAVASAVSLVAYRHSGRSSHIWISAAFALLTAEAVIDAVSFLDAMSSAPLTARHGLASVGALLLAARAVYGPMVDSRVTPTRAAATGIAVFAGVALLVLAGVAALRALYQPGAEGLRQLGLVAAWASAGSALIVGATTLPRSAARPHLFALGCFAVAAWLPLLAPSAADHDAMRRLLVSALAAVVTTFAGLHGLCRTAATQARVILAERVRVAEREHDIEAGRFRREERDHDLRSGLLAIEAGLATIVSSPSDPAATGRVATEVSIETARLRRMVEDSGPNGPMSLTDVRSVLAPVLLLERSRGVEVHAEITADAHARIPADVLVRVMHVLLDNARCHAAGGRVEVRARRRDDHVEVTVRDDGGLAPLDVGRDRCSRGERDGVTNHGVGLLSASRLIEEHGGHLLAESGHRGGMIFTIVLPLDRSTTAADNTPGRKIAGRRHTDRRIPA